MVLGRLEKEKPVKQSILSFLCAGICLAFALAGCGGGGGSTAPATHLPSDPPNPTSPSYQGSPPGGTGDPLDPGSPVLPPGSESGNDGYDMIFFEDYGVNPFILTEDEDTSTFGMDVDTASYTIARYYLQNGRLPDKDSVRTEEYVNYFEQDYPEPDAGGVFSVTLEGAKSQFGQPHYHLLKAGIKARDVSPDERPAANMVFVVDVSGSMNRQDRLEQVKKSLHMLADDLKAGDKVGLVIYSTQGEVISGLTSDHAAIMAAIDELKPGGSTNAGEGLKLAYAMAGEGYEEGKINRIILCSDGVANFGVTDPDAILAQVKSDAEKGITLTTLGFGMGNYNDVLMEKLANHGDGCYYYIDSEEEAARVFDNGAVQMLMVLASDAKIQVVFNKEIVDRYRLIGYENRLLDEEDFEDDSVDAGEVGAGQTVTALYEIRLKDEALGFPSSQVADVKIRYMNYQTGIIGTAEKPIIVRDVNREFGVASRLFRFTAGVVEFAEILKESIWANGSSFGDVLDVINGIAEDEKEKEFVELVNTAIQLQDE